MGQFKVFKEISIGGITKENLIQQLVSKGIQFNKYANLLFEHPTFSLSTKVENVKLVRVKHSDFGLNDLFSYQEFINQTSAEGLKLCPLYLGAFLRLEYLDQPEGPYLTIASAKPEADNDYPNGFYLRNYEKSLWLRGYRADDICEHPKGNEFIFLK